MNRIRQFNKDNSSRMVVERLLVMIVFICIGVPFFLMKRYLICSVFFGFSVIVLVRLMQVPSKVIIDDELVLFGKNKILWVDINKVEFTTAPPGRDSRDTAILIFIKNQKQIIYPKFYNSSKELRDLFQTMCTEKGIPFIVKDKGLY